MVADVINFLSQANTISILLFYVFALWAGLTIWTWFDISSRTDNFLLRFIAVVLVAVGAIVGFAVYLMVRPSLNKGEARLKLLEEKILESQGRLSLCQNCGEVADPEFIYCVNCGLQVRKECENCKRAINLSWDFCPYCASAQRGSLASKVSEVVELSEATGEKIGTRLLSLLKRIRLPKFPRQEVRKRGRPRKITIEEPKTKRPRGRPRKEVSPGSAET
ncbi:MAG: zinc ribbon domain-containing protein [Candidatus Woykebacteria bacterium]